MVNEQAPSPSWNRDSMNVSTHSKRASALLISNRGNAQSNTATMRDHHLHPHHHQHTNLAATHGSAPSAEGRLYESPLVPILGILRQKYGSAAGPDLSSSVSSGSNCVSGAAMAMESLNPLMNGSQQSSHHVPPKNDVNSQSSCPNCHGRRHFDPLGEVFYCLPQSSSQFGSSSTTATKILSSVYPWEKIAVETNTSCLIRSALPGDIDYLMHQSVEKKNTPFALVESVLTHISIGGGERKYSKSTRFSCAGTVDRSAFHNVEEGAAFEFARFIGVLSHEMNLEQFATAEAEAFKAIFSLIHSSVPTKKFAGVMALDALIPVASSDEDKKAIKFANNLSNALRSGGDFEFLAAVSRSLGKMARGTANADYVEFEVTRGVEWLRTDKSERRLAAALTLRELAINAPTSFYSKTNQMALGGSNEFFEHIIPVMRDPVPLVRATAADALAECIKIIIERRHRSKTALLCKMYEGVLEGLNSSRKALASSLGTTEDACMHGSLLIAGEMLKHTHDFMLPRFDELCKCILSFKNNQDALIRLAMVNIIPKLAKRCPGMFGRRYLEDFLKHLLLSACTPQSLKGPIDVRPVAFLAIGKLALVFKSTDDENVNLIGSRESWLVEIFGIVRAGLQRSSVGLLDTTNEALQCASDLVKALGKFAAPYSRELLNNMFESGLSESLIHSLRAISSSLPSEKSVIEERIMEELSLCLAGTNQIRALSDPIKRKKQVKEPTKNAQTDEENMTRIKSNLSLTSWGKKMPRKDIDNVLVSSRATTSTHVQEGTSGRQRRSSSIMGFGDQTSPAPSITISMTGGPEINAKLVLSLRTLGTLRERSNSETYFTLLPFVENVVVCYLSHPNLEVRREAALTCCRMLLPKSQNLDDIANDYLGFASRDVVEQVLRKLLQVAVSDPSPSVRFCIVKALDHRYVPFLCQVRHVHPLFLLLEDEVPTVRATALHLLGLLALHNPTLVLPSLRRMLMDLIIELRCGGDSGAGREPATRLLVVFLRAEALERVVHPFLPSIIRSLPLKGVPPRLASAALEALGELSQVTKEAMIPWIGDLIPHILETMQDQSSASKQRTSLRTLGQIVGGTGYVITPYLDYPHLLPLAISVLPGTKRAPWVLRREVMRTFGIIGALDPRRYNAMLAQSQKSSRGRVGGGLYIDTQNNEIDNGLKKGFTDAENGGHGQKSRAKGYVDDGHDDSEPAHLYMYEQYATTAQPVSKLLPPRRLIPTDDEFYPTVVVQALTRILKDSSLAVHHGLVMQAIMFVFNALGMRCVPFLKKIVPHILNTIRTCGQISLREALLQQVASLSGIVRDHLRPYVASIFEVVEEFWETRHLETVLLLVEKMASGVPNDMRNYAPQLVRLILASLEAPRISEWTEEVFEVESLRLELVSRSIRYLTMKGILSEYLHLLVPALIKLINSLVSMCSDYEIYQSKDERQAGVRDLTLAIINALSIILKSTDDAGSRRPGVANCSSSTLSARAAQPLLRMLREGRPTLKIGQALVEVLCTCAHLLGSQWVSFYDNAAKEAILKWQQMTIVEGSNVGEISSSASLSQYMTIVEDIRSRMEHTHENTSGLASVNSLHVFKPHQPVEKELSARSQDGGMSLSSSNDGVHMSSILLRSTIQSVNQPSQLRVNQANLQRAWDVSQRTAREDWDDWMRRFSVQLLREAPSPALRAAADLAHAYQPLARELFPAAFVCVWLELNDKYRANLIQSLETAFVADVSPDILQTLLNLAEFMEHDSIEGGLPIEISVLAELAEKCRAYAKALHYKEREYLLGSGGACVEALISINKKLELPDAALGILKAAQMRLGHSSYPLSSSIVLRGTNQGIPFQISPSQQQSGLKVKESWLAELGYWADALEMYERKLNENPRDVDAILGCMRCFDARGDWKEVLMLSSRSWDFLAHEFTAGAEHSQFLTRRSSSKNISDPRIVVRSDDASTKFVQNEAHREAIKFCSKAAWRLGQWNDLEMFAAQLVRGNGEMYNQKLVSNTNSKVGTARFGFREDNIPRVDFDGAFFSAILHIHRMEWSLAEDAIDAARRAMDSSFTALMTESYKRAYPSMVTAQTLAELEEIITYRKLESNAKTGIHRHGPSPGDVQEARDRLLSVWRKRLGGCRVDADVHSSITAVRSLVLESTDEIDATLNLSALSRRAQCFKLAERILCDPLVELSVGGLNSRVFGFCYPPELKLVTSHKSEQSLNSLVLESVDNLLHQYNDSQIQYSHELVEEAKGLERLNIQHRLYFAYVEHLWLTNKCDEAMERLSKLSHIVDLVGHCERSQNSSLRVACWMRLGDWKLSHTLSPGSPLPESLQFEVLNAYKRAATAKVDEYRSWHAWALMNFRIAQNQNDAMGLSKLKRNHGNDIINHIIAAVQGFVKAITLGTKRWSASVQQDMLNFLNCLFKFGDIPAINVAIKEGIELVTLECWLGCTPQLLARIHIKSPSIRSTLHPLLIKVGAKHPQALMYPLSVLLKSPVVERKIAAESLMNSLKAHSNALVEEALLVSSELIRVAILWLELWHEGLEDASRLYFGDGNVSGMLDVLLPLHEQLEKGPVTRREIDFYESFGRDLSEAHAYVKEYIRLTMINGGVIPTQGGFAKQNEDGRPLHARQNAEAEAALNEAWDRYYIVFRRINKQIPGLTTLELSQVSPALQNAHKLSLGVPGTYRVDGSYVKIERFNPIVQVITSKQRPRKIVLRGSDGKDYVFLLKGHEDLRQDERVMQLFGLVNALLARDRRTKNHDLNIQRYVITPLSHHVGLVGWVPHTETIHSHIRDYRESKKIVLNMENREMMKMAPDYDFLTVLQKIEVFETALQRATGNGMDLNEVFWMKSIDSEEWLERRTKYTRSLAVMSMVGYILGLGDRHPSNLMLDQISGRVLHIDFGDCFEVAMHREKFPEKVPFRLTRMLVNAMEVSGIEGSYRSTCDRTMGVLRDNRDSLVAMLEAFVHDPLISWRLLEQAKSDENVTASAVGVTQPPEADAVPTVDEEESSVGATGLPSAIKEGQNEDGGDDEEVLSEGTADVGDKITGEIALDTGENKRRIRGRSASLSVLPVSSHAKSMQIYSHIQSLAVNLSTSTRIASITEGNADRAGVIRNSVAKSRLDKNIRQRELHSFLDGEVVGAKEEALNERALKVIQRVQDKLSGTDFPGPDGIHGEPLDVSDQVQLLIAQATSSENLCQLFIGWCAFW